MDRAALDAAIGQGLAYGGWCPRGGWAEDFPTPPGLLTRYPLLRETPSADPAQRTAWNLRDSAAVLILTGEGGLGISRGTALARDLAVRGGKPLRIARLDDESAPAQTREWLDGLMTGHRAKRTFPLGIGGPRESEAPGIYQRAVEFLRAAIA